MGCGSTNGLESIIVRNALNRREFSVCVFMCVCSDPSCCAAAAVP